jgi:hypothetical protein
MEKLKFDGCVTIIRKRDGEVLEKHTQKNTVTNGMRLFMLGGNESGGNAGPENTLGAVLTLGKGNVVPSSSDIGVTTPCSFSRASNEDSFQLSNGTVAIGTFGRGWNDSELTSKMLYCKETLLKPNSDNSIRYRFKFIVPAESSYVDTISEVSLYAFNSSYSYIATSYYYICITHALLKDAEGQPYTMQKTALDELTIYYDLTVTSVSDAIVLCKKAHGPNGDRILSAAGGESLHTSLHLVGAHHFGDNTYFGDERDYDLQPDPAYHANANANTSFIAVVPTERVLRDLYNKRYIMRMLLGQRDCVEIRYPNSMFGTPEITDIPIGTGDGATVDFLAPISFFVRNSETVYKDGIALTRGVDYTLDNFNNADELPELYPSLHMLVVSRHEAHTSGGFDRIDTEDATLYSKRTDSGNYHGALHCVPVRDDTPAERKQYLDTLTMYTNEWIVLYMPVDDSEFRWDIDTVYLYMYSTGVTVDLEYSADGITFTNVLNGVDPHHANATNWYPFEKTKEEAWNKFTIPNTRASYWRIRFNASGNIQRPGLMMCHSASKYIHFNSAPEANASLTMKARVDRPYMDGNHVLDAGVSIQF